ncbi:CLCN3 [Cordylochernes scorpioides]|uniref:CLCN3 n=1 Tax=Cordylochernes scorpioides TaxID=51811 RepID=A0ABY6LKC2_9ARAC|nr:CLCN3 [Cordylochernes scorpioides]
MLTVFFDYQGIVHHEFQQQGSTITADSYLGVLRRLREAIRQKRLELTQNLEVPAGPLNLCVPLIPLQSRFGPLRLLPFWELKKKLKGRKFQNIEEIKVDSKKAMKAIPKTDYQRYFADWKKKVSLYSGYIGRHYPENLLTDHRLMTYRELPNFWRDSHKYSSDRNRMGNSLALLLFKHEYLTVCLAGHALPHPAHLATTRESCVACGSSDLPLAHS